MKRSPFLAAASAAALALGLTACSGTVADQVDAAEAPTSQTVQEACREIVQPITDSSSVVLESASNVTQPQEIVDMWNDLAVSFEDASSGIFNGEVTDATRSVHEAIITGRDEIKKALVDRDASAIPAMNAAMQRVQNSLTELNTLCS